MLLSNLDMHLNIVNITSSAVVIAFGSHFIAIIVHFIDVVNTKSTKVLSTDEGIGK